MNNLTAGDRPCVLPLVTVGTAFRRLTKAESTTSLRVLILSVAIFAIAAGARGAENRIANVHPLDPMTADEVKLAVDLIKKSGKCSENSLFPTVALKEPNKAMVKAFKSGENPQRQLAVVVLDRAKGVTDEVVVDLQKKEISSFKEIPGVQPPISPEELNQVPKIVRANSRWQDAMKKRGVTNFEGVMIDPWAPGTLYPSENPKNRWVRALSYMKDTNINGYARPIEGVVAVVNMNTRKVDRIIDYGQHPIPPKISDLNEKAVEKSLGKLREAPKPLKIEQPKGPSFELSGANGQEVVWQKWHFRFTVHPRDGLTLYQVGYEDRGHIRPILYKASLSEMVVPYGESDEGWIFRNAFDVGEYGIGRLTDSMDAGVEAPENAKFFDLTFSDDFGAPFTTPRGVALFERDGGLMWKHFEFYNNSSDARRARELVLMNVVTVGNYDYGFQWIFRQDGSLELQAMLTGIMLAKGVDAKSVDDPAAKGLAHAGHWHLVAPYVACPHHQHFFNFRIDWDVDGENNSVSELNVKSLPPGPKNKAANAFIMEHKIFKTEKEAQRELNLDSNRKWIVTNTTEKDSLGYNTGYALLPGDSTRPYISPQSKVRRRAGFIDHHVWVTPYKEDEQHAAGEYPNQSVGAQGLALWTKADRKIEDTDLVMWYTFGVTHTPRPEEWPVMPVTTAGFKLVPVGFFSQNPAMDLPVTK